MRLDLDLQNTNKMSPFGVAKLLLLCAQSEKDPGKVIGDLIDLLDSGSSNLTMRNMPNGASVANEVANELSKATTKAITEVAIPGTEWVAPGSGMKVSTIRDAMKSLSNERADKALSYLSTYDKDLRTNLLLTGEPLTGVDLDRIATCDVR